MGASNRTLVILGSVVLVVIVLAGWGLKALLARPKSPQERTEEFARQAQAQAQAQARAPGQMPDMAKLASMAGMSGSNLSPATQVAMLQLVQKHQISMGVAAYLVQAKAQVLSQSSNSVRYSLTFPDGISFETMITLTPSQKYSPTPAEIAWAQKTGVQAYRVQFSAKTESETKARMTLRYFVPDAAVPASLRQRLQNSSASFFQLIPPAHADGGNLGVDVVSDTGVEVTKEVLKQAAERGELSKEFPVPLSRFVDTLNAFKKETEHLDWMDQLNFLDYCASNPTNPLTRKAYEQDPNYQNQTLEGLQDARSDVMGMTAMRFLNLATSAATDLVEGPMGAITAPISSYNDGTLKNLADDRVNEAKKGVPDCKPAQRFEGGPYQPMQGNFKYSYNLSAQECRTQCVEYQEERQFEGTVHLVPDSFGYLVGKGSGMIKVKKNQHAYDQYCKNSGWHEDLNGNAEIDLKVGGDSPQNGAVIANFTGNALTRDGETIGCNGDKQSLSGNGSTGASCEFHDVDLVHGGSYSAFEAGDPHGTCKLELFPE
jgi:hypothetical protein